MKKYFKFIFEILFFLQNKFLYKVDKIMKIIYNYINLSINKCTNGFETNYYKIKTDKDNAEIIKEDNPPKLIYSYNKKNIVGTDICSREINKELFTEDLFNFLKSEENKSGFIKFDYDNYDSLLKNSNEIKEKECEELNEER